MKMIKPYLKYLVLLIVLGILIFSPLRQVFNIELIKNYLTSLGDSPLAYLLYVFFYVLGVVLVLPGVPLTLLGGAIFGLVRGSILVIIGSNLGVYVTFFITRLFGSSIAERFIGDNSRFGELNAKINANGFSYMLFLRLLPIVPFNVLNYVAGLTRIKFRDYALASFLGMFMGTILYVYFGAAAIDYRENPLGLVLSISLLIVFTVVGLLLKRRAEKREALLDQAKGETDAR